MRANFQVALACALGLVLCVAGAAMGAEHIYPSLELQQKLDLGQDMRLTNAPNTLFAGNFPSVLDSNSAVLFSGGNDHLRADAGTPRTFLAEDGINACTPIGNGVSRCTLLARQDGRILLDSDPFAVKRAEPGRFHAFGIGNRLGVHDLYLLDTATGRLWHFNTRDRAWKHLVDAP